jgi:hypothetical protein
MEALADFRFFMLESIFGISAKMPQSSGTGFQPVQFLGQQTNTTGKMPVPLPLQRSRFFI